MENIIVNDIYKNFKVNSSAEMFLKSLLSLKLKRQKSRYIEVIKGISFEVKSGEILGLIGENGSGKSTLLRIISGIYKQDSGKIKVNGKILSMINLSIGLQDMLTMKDNIYLLGALFGMKRKEIKKKFNSIVKFSELSKFVNTRLYKFSNGMLQRIAFSTVIHCNPKILLLDEVFEVGDEEFKKKNVEKIKEKVKEGGSVILVSHNMEMIEKYCDRVIWIKDGKIKKEGLPKRIVKEYTKESNLIK